MHLDRLGEIQGLALLSCILICHSPSPLHPQSCRFHTLICLLLLAPTAVSGALSQAPWHCLALISFFSLILNFSLYQLFLLAKSALPPSPEVCILVTHHTPGDSTFLGVFGSADFCVYPQHPYSVVFIPFVQDVDYVPWETGCAPHTKG